MPIPETLTPEQAQARLFRLREILDTQGREAALELLSHPYVQQDLEETLQETRAKAIALTRQLDELHHPTLLQVLMEDD